MDSEQLQSMSRIERVQFLFGFGPFEYQAELIAHGADEPVAKAAVKPGRQVGKTLTGGAIAAERALSGKDVMILGPFEDTVKEMMEAAVNHLLAAETKFGDGILGTEQRNKTDWIFEVAGRLRARTVGTDGTQIRGKNPEVVLVDEAAYIKDAIFTEVVEPFFSTHTEYEFYLFSTPAGKTGYFYDAVEGPKAEAWFSPHWPSRISPLISDEWIAEKQEELDSLTFAQEYEGEFVDEADSYIPYELAKSCQSDQELTGETFLGVDVARKGKDRTVYTAVDESGSVQVLDSEETSTVPGIIGRIKDLHETHSFVGVYVDENAVGGGVVDDPGLQDILYGVTFSTQTKHKMYKNLKTALENGALALPNHRRLLSELTSLEFSFTQNGYVKVSHPDGGHDDFPDSLALATYGKDILGSMEVTRRKGVTTQRFGGD